MLVWLVLGAALNVAVAWTIFAAGPTTLGRSQATLLGTSQATMDPTPHWPDMVITLTPWPKPMASKTAVMFGYTECQSAGIGVGGHIAGSLTFGEGPRLREMFAVSVGWPARAMRSVAACNLADFLTSPYQSIWLEGYELPTYWPGPRLSSSSGASLPTHLLWPGFLINTLFYASLVSGFWLVSGAVKRWRRHAKQLCIHCAYPVGDTAKPCPECGKPVQS